MYEDIFRHYKLLNHERHNSKINYWFDGGVDYRNTILNQTLHLTESYLFGSVQTEKKFIKLNAKQIKMLKYLEKEIFVSKLCALIEQLLPFIHQ